MMSDLEISVLNHSATCTGADDVDVDRSICLYLHVTVCLCGVHLQPYTCLMNNHNTVEFPVNLVRESKVGCLII